MTLTDHTKRQLLEAAASFARLQPWQSLTESDIFALDCPEIGDKGYCVVLGNDGDFSGISVMRGNRGLVLYEDMLFDDEDESAADSTQQDCLMLSFYDKDDYPDELMAEMHRLGATVAGDEYYPVFEDYSPGLFPWDVNTEAQAAILLRALACTLDLHKQTLDRGESVLMPPASAEESVVPLMHKGNHGWEIARWLDVSNVEMPPMTAESDPKALLEALKDLTFRRNSAWAVSMVMLPEPVQESPEERPYFPFLIIAIELEHGAIIGHRMVSPADFSDSLQTEMSEMIREAGYLPERVITINEEETDLFGAILDPAGIQIIIDPEAAHMIEGIAEALFGSMNGGEDTKDYN